MTEQILSDIGTEIGVSATALALVGVVIRFFMKWVERKDEHIKNLTDKAIEHGDKVTSQFVAASEKQAESNVKVANQLDRLTNQVENANTNIVGVLGKNAEALGNNYKRWSKLDNTLNQLEKKL